MNDTKTVTLQVSGMLRATSKNVIEAHLSRQPGVIAVDANPVSQTATVTYDPETTSVAHLQQWVIDCGYHCAGQSVPDHICDPAHDPHDEGAHDHSAHHGPAAEGAQEPHASHDAHEGHTDATGHASHAGHKGPAGYHDDPVHDHAAGHDHTHAPSATADDGEQAGHHVEHAGHTAAAGGHDHGAASGHSAQEMMGHGGHHGGMSMDAMIRDMRNRFLVALILSIPITLWSPIGR